MKNLILLKVSKKSKLPRSFDARDWTKEWLEIVKNNPSIPFDEGTMIGWFSNALMAGWDEHERKNRKKIEKIKLKLKCLKDENEGLKNFIRKNRKL